MSERQDRDRTGRVSPEDVPDAGGDRGRRRYTDRQRDSLPGDDHQRDSFPGDDHRGDDRLGDVSLPEAFALLGHDDRLALVASVVSARDTPSREYPVPFSTLRDATGFRDTGRLAYHVGRLTGRFLVRTSAGYAVDERGFDVLRVPLAQYADGR